MAYLIDAYDAADNLVGQRSVSSSKIDGYFARAKRKGLSLELSDFAFLDGELCIDSQYPNDYFS
ncbi:hypothetical protein [Nocardia jiangxiensis]|uniref:hypothetical protein n=1 Tax=Nocardia jiangxiensis TaxID=282685 RepID=UPI0002DBA19C|nr:hypothetical protein [Nocardia jiangxiensis]